MTAPPARAIFAGSPDHAAAKSWLLQFVDFLYDRLGGGAGAADSSEQDVSCGYLGAVRRTQIYGQSNIIINGGFQVNQRGATSVADDAYCLDRWYALTETGNVTVAQQADQENGTPFNIRLTQPDASIKQIGLAQIVEAANCKVLRGRTVTLSARIRCSAAVQINYAVLEWAGTADAVTSDVISAWGGSPTYVASITERAKGTITPGAATWTDVTALNAAVNSGTNNLIVLFWSNADLAQNVTLDIARVQLEPGTYAKPFEYQPIGTVLQQCQRYYWKTYMQGVAPATATIDGAVNMGRAYDTQVSTQVAYVPFPVEMRAAPSASFYNPLTGASGTWSDSGNTARTMAASMIGTRSCSASNSVSVSLGTTLSGHMTLNAEL